MSYTTPTPALERSMTIPVLTVALNPALMDNLGVKAEITTYLCSSRSPLNGRAFEVRFAAGPLEGVGFVRKALLVGAPRMKGIGPVRQSRLAALVSQAASVAVFNQGLRFR